MGNNKDLSELELNLTPKQELFCVEYIKDFNQTKAAIRAGYSPKTARQTGYENMKKPDIQRRVNELKAERLAKYEITPEKTLKEVGKIAYQNLFDYLDPDEDGLVDIKKLKNLHPDDMGSIQEIIIDPTMFGNRVKLKFHSKTKGLEMLMQYQGLLNNNQDNQEMTAEKLLKYKQIMALIKERDGE